MNQLTLTECSKRKLDDTYIVVYAIKNEINIKKADFLKNIKSNYIFRILYTRQT